MLETLVHGALDSSHEALSLGSNADIAKVEELLLNTPQVECPLVHRFAPGVYMREVEMAKGTWVIGHEHLTEHGNVVLSGRALVSMNGEVGMITAPYVFVSPPGLRKVLIILEDMRFMTIHPNPTNETDIDKLEAMFVRKSACYLRHQEELKLLAETIKKL